MDRFTLEDRIMKAWHTTEDLELLLRGLPEESDIYKNLGAVIEIHNLRCVDLMRVFEDLVKDGVID